jgi:hypothetical protein
LPDTAPTSRLCHIYVTNDGSSNGGADSVTVYPAEAKATWRPPLR